MCSYNGDAEFGPGREQKLNMIAVHLFQTR